MQRNVGGNPLVVEGGNSAINSRTLLGSVGRGKADLCPLDGSLLLEGFHLQLFSGGDSMLPLSVPGDAVLYCLKPGKDFFRPKPEDESGAVDVAAYKFQCSEGLDNCPPVWIQQNTTQSAGWNRVHKAYCVDMHGDVVFRQSGNLPGCHLPKCDETTEICHSPGEQFHTLVPANDQWLLVTRQGWPVDSEAYRQSDLFRVLSFSPPAGGEPQRSDTAFELVVNRDIETTGEVKERGHLYAGERVVPEGNGPRFALFDNNTLWHAYQHTDATNATQTYLRWTRFPLNAPTDATDFTRGSDWPLPSGSRLMLLSKEDDGVNLWVKQAGGVVKRFALEEIKQQGENATKTFALTSESNMQEPVALARYQDWLYSLQAMGEGEEFQIRRWNISGDTAIPDPACNHTNVTAMKTDSLFVNGSRVLVVPEGRLPARTGNDSVAIGPHVPEEGGCLKWQTQSLEQPRQCAVSTTPAGGSSPTVLVVTSEAGQPVSPSSKVASSTVLVLPSSTTGAMTFTGAPLPSSDTEPVISSEVPVEAAISAVVVLPAGCLALIVAGCVYHVCHNKNAGKAVVDDQMVLRDLQQGQDAQNGREGGNVYDEVGGEAPHGEQGPARDGPDVAAPGGEALHDEKGAVRDGADMAAPGGESSLGENGPVPDVLPPDVDKLRGDIPSPVPPLPRTSSEDSRRRSVSPHP
ncbi:MAG: hypothetical protein OXC07_11205, partial [Kistimonas sp.]|nr:hypothetical protein [Kistimonas sp.]